MAAPSPTQANRPLTESEAVAEAARGTHSIKRLFPMEREGHDELAPLISRFRGKEPDAYDFIQAGVFLEALRTLKEKAMMQRFGKPSDGGIAFKWENVSDHEILSALSDLTISMGGGKGRKEGVELGKSTPMAAPTSRWHIRKEK